LEVNALRAVVARWEAGAYHVSGPKPDGQLGAIVEVMLGTSARIGEVLAIRRRDVDLTNAAPTIRLAGVRRRLAIAHDVDPDSLLFSSREGTPLTTANVRRQLRHVLEKGGITGVTPHLFRRTVATAVNDNASLELAAELLGHTNTKTTVQHYIRRNELVDPATAELLDSVFEGRHLRLLRRGTDRTKLPHQTADARVVKLTIHHPDGGATLRRVGSQ